MKKHMRVIKKYVNCIDVGRIGFKNSNLAHVSCEILKSIDKRCFIQFG